eukprot:Phypoly_transcript_01089.p1 GENE.Phypoly_transcript_01089~~Phypoly_transcript_01089.p1  ORF type:complete len:1180 (+),score=247.08 Phypoly_transcript_01089:133-3672(+)
MPDTTTPTTKEPNSNNKEKNKDKTNNMNNKTKPLSYPPSIEGVYSYWFANGDLNSLSYVHNGKVWWKGLREVDTEIREFFGQIVEKALANDEMVEEWKKTPKGTVALIIMLDQFTRNIFRGTPKMFSGDDQAMELTKYAISQKWDEVVSLPERLFIYMPFQHTENVEDANLGVSMAQALLSACAPGSQTNKYLSLVRSFERHAAIVRVYGRYPHRNQVLGRISTLEEEEFLQKNLSTNRFMRSVSARTPEEGEADTKEPKESTQKDNGATDQPNKKPIARVLMLHSFRQNAQLMKKRTAKLRKAFAAVGIELVYVNAPIAYEAQGEEKDTVLKTFGKLPPTEHQRCFWMSQDNNNVYEGVDVSIRYLSDLFTTQGPFLGVMAFSHGGAMAAILAALQPFESVKFSFAIFISAYPARARDYKDYFLPNKQKLPSLHILGHKDLLMDPERSRALANAFQDSILLEHNGGHFVPDTWPSEAMAKFAAKFLPSEAPIEPDLLPDKNVVLNNFISKLEATIVNSTYAEPIGISQKSRALLSEEFWKTWITSPLDTSLEGVRKFVTNALETASSPEEQDVIAEDLFVIAYSGRIVKIPRNKFAKNPNIPKTDELFCQVVTFVYLLSNYAARLLGLMTKYCGWRDLVGIAVQAHRIAAASPDTVEKQKLDALIQEIVQLFASQLRKDLLTITQAHGMPSTCVQGAPRLKSSADKEMKLALSVALALHPITEKISELAKKTRVEKQYQKTLRILTDKLQVASAAEATRKQLKRTALETNYVSQFSHSLPVPTNIVNPEPEPVTVAPLEELAPLFNHLKNNYPVPQQISFARGSLLPDGRLDLCKMVVGPTGIKPLLECMEGNDSVKRLLLGNNIVGNQGARWISEFITNKGSKLTTWYIAGNDITAEGIEPICKALEGDMQVEQLWLKRNPLMPAGAIPLARLLTHNSYLQVLDLVNTGLLDEGTATILKALEHNSTLRHLYLGTNGITSASAGPISNYLAKHNKLQSLYLSLNRIGDEGAKQIAEGLKSNTNLERFSLASNRLTASGVSAIADAIKGHPTLVLLDLGFTKATTTLGEVGNLMGDQGAEKLADLLRTNSTLRSLDVLHNSIGQLGLNALRDALRTNTTLTTLNYTQFGKAANELVKEETKLLLQRNCSLAGDKLPELQKIDFPQHIVEILSVYRTHV